jgi:hypothetical protein
MTYITNLEQPIDSPVKDNGDEKLSQLVDPPADHVWKPHETLQKPKAKEGHLAKPTVYNNRRGNSLL